ncbi:MAG: ribbon-helix-helix domain-containing protein [Nitrospira sp.]|jgi:metal-responsive CopG/Arc/MetJ family transcriptional regulator|nr:ribbon-helix-helix domain-containing protein [Nitrospira sp.]
MANLVRIVIQLPEELKQQLDALRQQGYTASGFIRAMLERELPKHAPAQPPVLQVVPPKKRVARA